MAWLLVLLLAVPPGILAESTEGSKTFKQEELDQMLAPIALYPDELLSQIFMASTYPLEVVQAWALPGLMQAWALPWRSSRAWTHGGPGLSPEAHRGPGLIEA